MIARSGLIASTEKHAAAADAVRMVDNQRTAAIDVSRFFFEIIRETVQARLIGEHGVLLVPVASGGLAA